MRFRAFPAVLTACGLAAPAQAAAPVDFAREVAPLLERSCLRCHTPGNAKGGIALATAAGLARAGTSSRASRRRACCST